MTQDTSLPEIDLGCAAQTLRRAARLMSKRYEEALRPANLTVSQFSILRALTQAKELPFGTLSKVLGLDQTTLSRLLKTLEKRALISVRIDEDDRRNRIAEITSEGRQLFESATILWQKVNDESLSRLGKREWQDVKEALKTLSS